MRVDSFDDATRFLTEARSYLLAEEAANNLALGVSADASAGHYEQFVGLLVTEGTEVLAAAVRTPPHNLILARSDSIEAVELIDMAAGDVPGVIGCVPEVEWLVGRHPGATRRFRLGIYQTTQVVAPSTFASRPATFQHRRLLIAWLIAFADETGQDRLDHERAARHIERRLRDQGEASGIWVVEHGGEVVSMSGYSGPTPNGIRIGPVYTPPGQRGRGYASSLVAAQTRWLLANGKELCFLYTDLDNPTANAIYQRIGYEMVAESCDYEFSRMT